MTSDEKPLIEEAKAHAFGEGVLWVLLVLAFVLIIFFLGVWLGWELPGIILYWFHQAERVPSLR